MVHFNNHSHGPGTQLGFSKAVIINIFITCCPAWTINRVVIFRNDFGISTALTHLAVEPRSQMALNKQHTIYYCADGREVQITLTISHKWIQISLSSRASVCMNVLQSCFSNWLKIEKLRKHLLTHWRCHWGTYQYGSKRLELICCLLLFRKEIGWKSRRW